MLGRRYHESTDAVSPMKYILFCPRTPHKRFLLFCRIWQGHKFISDPIIGPEKFIMLIDQA
jgi:hypothetical protein